MHQFVCIHMYVTSDVCHINARIHRYRSVNLVSVLRTLKQNWCRFLPMITDGTAKKLACQQRKYTLTSNHLAFKAHLEHIVLFRCKCKFARCSVFFVEKNMSFGISHL